MNGLREPVRKKLKQVPETQKADLLDLPCLAFEKILSYLSLEDRIRSRSVSRHWRKRFDLKLKSLFCSDRPIEFILKGSRLASNPYARNFVCLPRVKSCGFLESFFNTFRQSVLCNLKRLRLWGLRFDRPDQAAFFQAIDSFAQLEELELIQLICNSNYYLSEHYGPVSAELNLPMLRSIQIKAVEGISILTLDSPKLQKVKIWLCYSLNLKILHCRSVESIFIDCPEKLGVKEKVHYESYLEVDSGFLSKLEALKELQLTDSRYLPELFEQKRRYGRSDLRIYLRGLLLDGPADPTIEEVFYLAKDISRLADEISCWHILDYSSIERIAPSTATKVGKRITDLYGLRVREPVKDIERFLNFLENIEIIETLELWCDQPQELFDRLPGHCAIQWLTIHKAPSNLDFLLEFKNLAYLLLYSYVDVETVRKVFDELPFVLSVYFETRWQTVMIETNRRSKLFQVRVDRQRFKDLPDLNVAIEVLKDMMEE